MPLQEKNRDGHRGVMVDEVISILSQHLDDPLDHPLRFLDMTFGRGGHSRGFLQQWPHGEVLALDRDKEAVDHGCRTLGLEYPHGFSIVQGVFSDVHPLFASKAPFHGILADFGVSSPQLDNPQRGFSFQKEGPLDMRMDSDQTFCALDIIHAWPEQRLADIFFHWGQERYSRRIARAIVARRKEKPFQTTTDLAHVVRKCVPGGGRYDIHPATRTFQALRMAVNDELNQIQQGLERALPLLAEGGVFLTIAFHSLEDRLAKLFFRNHYSPRENNPGSFRWISKKPLAPTPGEVQNNSRCRSARLRWGRLWKNSEETDSFNIKKTVFCESYQNNKENI